MDAGGCFWLDIKTFKARTCTSHLPHKTLEPRTDCYGDLHFFPVRAIFKESRHQILAEPQAHLWLCSPAFKRRGRRTEISLQSGEEGDVYFVSTGYLASGEFLSLLAFGSASCGKSLCCWSITRAPNPRPGEWDTVLLLRALAKSRPLDSKPLSQSQRESALGKTILRDISALYPFISSHRCTKTILVVQWNTK